MRNRNELFMMVMFYGQMFLMFFLLGFLGLPFENTICIMVFIIYRVLYDKWILDPMIEDGRL